MTQKGGGISAPAFSDNGGGKKPPQESAYRQLLGSHLDSMLPP